jgi:hypothetical protein
MRRCPRPPTLASVVGIAAFGVLVAISNWPTPRPIGLERVEGLSSRTRFYANVGDGSVKSLALQEPGLMRLKLRSLCKPHEDFDWDTHYGRIEQ